MINFLLIYIMMNYMDGKISLKECVFSTFYLCSTVFSGHCFVERWRTIIFKGLE